MAWSSMRRVVTLWNLRFSAFSFDVASVRVEVVALASVPVSRVVKAGKLFATAVKPQAAYGLMVQGAGPSVRAEHRRLAAVSAAPPGHHSCGLLKA